ncbi:hypothetical protein BOX15_Mlig030614g1, partial [Macrostomum lignano]
KSKKMMSENNMTVIALESDSESGADSQQPAKQDLSSQQQPALLPTSSIEAAGSSALPNSNPEWMQHWSETLRYSSQSGRFAEYGTSSSAALEAAGASGGASSVSALTGAGATSSNADSAGHLEGGASEEEEKLRLVTQIAELQSTLDDLSQRVETVKEENLKLSSENRILGQYIENLMAASSVFAAATADGDASPKARKRGQGGHSARRYNRPQ